MKEYRISEVENIHILGRTYLSEEYLYLFWSGSGIELETDASEMYLDIFTDYEKNEPWLEVIIDGNMNQRLMLEKGDHRICIFRNMDKGRFRRVRIIKCTQPHRSDLSEVFRIGSIYTDGSFGEKHEYSMKLECIGDSITSGEGLGGAVGEFSNNSSVFGVRGSYHSFLAERFNADVKVISQSGYGVYCGWCGLVEESIPRYYDAICGVSNGRYLEEDKAHDRWDFGSWTPYYIIVNLGTNDSGSFDLGGQYIEEKDFVDPMRKDENGEMVEEDRQKVVGAVISFLKQLRDRNPSSVIIWCYGMAKGRLMSTLEEAVGLYVDESGDKDAYFVALPGTAEDEVGSRHHPGVPSHKKAADVLGDFIDSLKTGN